ncbi:hypothetical protein ABKV94_18190 [Enterobacter hormaechei]|uniref:hypothetical protein n=1 Tax=Enterobacteriaceae TaxID=543 RepID=UPI00079AE953|nr:MULTISPECIES: hypothetical protein [Enterobacteriaceae]EEY1522812.1 hypothetical protein [Escherichia coli O126]EMB9643054.1 hypothetical protein [Enterobacter cloacae]HDR9901672.1 hypothetical protein [Escherichia coli C309-64 (10g)]EEQ3014047.1 hypothetical protein [Escherichia coli]EET4755013.1 hypothetical protein [Escherichia coli]
MHIKFQQHVYQALLAEAIRQDKPLARLCNEILETAAHIFDNTPGIKPALASKATLNGDINDRDSKN